MFRTAGLQNYCARFSCFSPDLFAVGACQHYGIVGNGKLFVLRVVGNPEQLNQVRFFDTADAIFDCCWSEINPNQILCATGDGSIKIFDLTSRDNLPVQQYLGHSQDCASVDWNLVSKIKFLSSSYNGEVKMWDPIQSGQTPIVSFMEHRGPVYCVKWSPFFDTTSFSCSGDGTLKLWDLNQGRHSALTIKASNGEVLSIDCNKYNNHQIISSGDTKDPVIKLWDLRQTTRPVNIFSNHRFGIRKVVFSPHNGNIFASTGYDMAINVWNLNQPAPLMNSLNHHTEFVFGLDFALFVPNRLVSASWDEKIIYFNPFTAPSPQLTISR